MPASGPKAAEAAGRIGDAMVVTSGDKELVKASAARAVAASRLRAGDRLLGPRRSLREEDAPQDLADGRDSKAWRRRSCRCPLHFEQLTKSVTEDQLAEHTPCGPDIDRHVASLQEYVDAGIDHVYVHQVGPDQAAFIEAYAKDVLPRLRGQRSKAASAA